MRILIHSSYGSREAAEVARRGGAEPAVIETIPELIAAVGDADALWLLPRTYDAALRDAIAAHRERLRWIQLFSMGYDPIEEHGPPPGVTITNAGDAFGPTVAEHAVASLLALFRRFPEALHVQAQRRWATGEIAPRIGTLVDGTVTVLGLGNIGREIARRVRACGARVIGVTRSGRPSPDADEVFPVDGLRDALRRSDALIIAVPLTAATQRIVDAEALAALPRHAVVVNIARGGVIDQEALVCALHAGTIAGAALDVSDPEPPGPNDRIWDAPNLLLTPHVAGYGFQVPFRRLVGVMERNLAAFRDGRPFEAVVFSAVPA